MTERPTTEDHHLDRSSVSTVTGSVRGGGSPWPVTLALIALAGLSLGWLLTRQSAVSRDHPPSGSDGAQQPSQLGRSDTLGSVARLLAEESVPQSLLAAERFAVDPGPRTLKDLLASVGGLDALELGQVAGSFDLLRFDPDDPDRLLATVRSSYGDANNQDTNEFWIVGPDGLARELWAPDTAHDFAHFNADGTITMWITTEVGSRRAVTLDQQGEVLSSSDPVYASRFAVADGTLFALTGNGDYYSNEAGYEQLIADTGMATTILDSGEEYGWIDSPSPELLLAYPRGDEALTAVWDTTTLRRLENHPLAGRPYLRVAISGDRKVFVGINSDGGLALIDPTTGEQIRVFGTIDPTGIDQPITLNHDGTIALTVEQSGAVKMWWVGFGEPIAVLAADAAQPRWVSGEFAAKSSSAVAADASRLALRGAARPQVPVTWTVVDTSTTRWIEAACSLAGRSLLPSEREALGLVSGPTACP